MATLGFSTKWPKHMGGGDTLFVPKIWRGLIDNQLAHYRNAENSWCEFSEKAEAVDSNYYEWFSGNTVFVQEQTPKLHTMRKDPKGLWVPGRKIHMVVFNRTKKRFQFAPIIPVKKVQKVEITYKKRIKYPIIRIDNTEFDVGKRYDLEVMRQLAFNDGFNSLDHFCQWFNTNDTLKLIHWTDLKY